MLLPLGEQLCFAEEVLCFLTSGSSISGFLVTKSPGHRELSSLDVNFLFPSRVFQELKDNLFSNLIYSHHIRNSDTQLTPTPLALQQRDTHPSHRSQTYPGTSALLSLFCTLHSRHSDSSIIRNIYQNMKISPSII